jgi:Xaa-Pro aminopeptidase
MWNIYITRNPDMYYFSGYKEPHSLLIIFKEEQKGTDGSSYKEIIYVQKKMQGPNNGQGDD